MQALMNMRKSSVDLPLPTKRQIRQPYQKNFNPKSRNPMPTPEIRYSSFDTPIEILKNKTETEDMVRKHRHL